MWCQESRTGDWVQLRKLGILSLSKIAEHWKGTQYVVGKNKDDCQHIKSSLGAARNGGKQLSRWYIVIIIWPLGSWKGEVRWIHYEAMVTGSQEISYVMIKGEIWISLANKIRGWVVKKEIHPCRIHSLEWKASSPHIRVHSTPPLTQSKDNELTYCLEG